MKLWRLIFTIWVFFWLFFLARGFVKGEFEKFKALLFLDLNEKNAYILGDELNTFLNLCKSEMPEGGTYKIAGDLDEHNRFRLIYHLYPRLQSDDPDYILNISAGDSQYRLRRIK